MEPVWLGIVVAVGALLTTALTTTLNAWQIRKGKDQDYARQDAVAAQAAEAARLLEARQDAIQHKAEEAAQLLLDSNKRVAVQAARAFEITNGKLAQIHELVNSNLTAQMEEAHAALIQQLVLMREVVSLNMASGRKASIESMQAISIIERKVAELGAKLNDRAEATKIADSQLK